MFCGIDFGTTNSSISIAKNGKTPKLILFPNGKNTIPTAVFYPEEKSLTPLFGDEAVLAYITGATGRFMRSMKRVLGSTIMLSGTTINGSFVKFNTILGQFIAYLKNQAEASCGETLDAVVMGRPVHFCNNNPSGDKNAQKELENIARFVGFKDVAFQFEPIAAAYAHEIHLQRECIACVVDIGGGTSDFTIIKIGPNLKNKTSRTDDILASTGICIGGNDFDKDLCLRCFMPTFGLGTLGGGKSKYDKVLPLATVPYHTLSKWSEVNTMYVQKEKNYIKKMLYESQEPDKVKRLLELVEKERGHTLLSAVETTKIQLSSSDHVGITLKFISDFPRISVEKGDFECSLKTDINLISKSLGECLNQAQIAAEDIQMVILTGGSTEIPIIQHTIKNIFPQAEISQENKLSSVGLGLAYDSLRCFGSRLYNGGVLNINKNNDGR